MVIALTPRERGACRAYDAVFLALNMLPGFDTRVALINQFQGRHNLCSATNVEWFNAARHRQ